MKVRELIAKLAEAPQDMEVVTDERGWPVEDFYVSADEQPVVVLKTHPS